MDSPRFESGDVALIIDSKSRRYLVKLDPNGQFTTHQGTIPHVELIGSLHGTMFETPSGGKFIALPPKLTDYILKMKRGAQIIYPKDIGPILVYGDVAPGSVVLEAGTGSGALTMALVRAVGPTGKVVSVDRREDHAGQAEKSISRFFGGLPDNLELRIGEVEDMIAEVGPDRLILDLPEPWHAAAIAAKHLQPGGVFCSYVPTVPQMEQTVTALKAAHAFTDIMNFEALIRTWNVEGRSVRPDHQMVGHTGFLTVARRVQSWGGGADESEEE
ncbi:MAG: tRNA (adenine-N1)-methyltransferase [Acidimicrobiia bacterium]|nr:tRNA (adenine-N1)-methyltransferase [Acidimicrobiia bacterium]